MLCLHSSGILFDRKTRLNNLVRQTRNIVGTSISFAISLATMRQLGNPSFLYDSKYSIISCIRSNVESMHMVGDCNFLLTLFMANKTSCQITILMDCVQSTAASAYPAASISGATSFMDWWRSAHERSTRLIQKGFNSLVVLGAWMLWKHRNRCVFDGVAPCMAVAMTQAEEERKVWELAGARGVAYLTAQSPSN
jgi:hypothetical protein